MAWLSEKALTGEFVSLEPLTSEHIAPLAAAVKDGEGWKLWYAAVPLPENMENYVNSAIAAAKQGNIAYAVRSHAHDKIVGTTRFYSVDEPNRRAMLGYTWYAKTVQRSPVNTECKLLMLQHLFETHAAIAVEFRTHFFNQASRTAIERLGAKLDGILRSHIIMKDGSIRDTVAYSIIASEWPSVRNNLRAKLTPRNAD